MKEGSAAAGNQQSNWLRSLLVIGEVAAALVLLIGASLLIKSFSRLQRTESGLRPENVLTASLSLPDTKYKTPQAISQFHKQMLDRLSSLPGVQSAGIISKLPLQEWGYNGSIQIEGQAPPPPDSLDQYVEFRAVSPDYFRTLGVPLLAGRLPDEGDQADAASVMLVNESLVRRLFAGQPPPPAALGKFITVGNLKARIVGVVGDVKQSGLVQPTRPEIYWPYAQAPDGLISSVSLVVRSTGEPTGLTATVRNAVLAVDPAQAIHNVQTMEQVIYDSVSDRRLNTLLLTLFAAVALALALVGVYSVMSYLVAQNTREIGIRIALGAQVRDVLRLVIGQGLVLAGIGIAIGLIAAFALTRLMEGLLFGVGATDPLTFAGVSALLLAVALTACYLPARRATKVDPMVALRHE